MTMKRMKKPKSVLLGDPEVTANIYCKPSQNRYPKLQYRFAVTSGSPSINGIILKTNKERLSAKTKTLKG